MKTGAVEGKGGKGGGKASKKKGEREKKMREKDDNVEGGVHASCQLPPQVEQPLHPHDVLKRNKYY